jgi:hypothetical protein
VSSPSQVHAILVDVFRAMPGFALARLRAMGVGDAEVLGATPRIVESTFPVTTPDYHVDLAIACDSSTHPALVVLLEVQLRRDADKRRSWPLYEAAAVARFKSKACVLVVTLDEKVEAWAAKPVSMGPSGSVFRAVVLGPSALLRVPEEAAKQEPRSLCYPHSATASGNRTASASPSWPSKGSRATRSG